MDGDTEITSVAKNFLVQVATCVIGGEARLVGYAVALIK